MAHAERWSTVDHDVAFGQDVSDRLATSGARQYQVDCSHLANIDIRYPGWLENKGEVEHAVNQTPARVMRSG